MFPMAESPLIIGETLQLTDHDDADAGTGRPTPLLRLPNPWVDAGLSRVRLETIR
jgi:hypothetical protein